MRPFGNAGLHLPPWVHNMTQTSFQFFLGPPGSGSHMHFHRDALNVLVYGRKRWFLTHPNNTACSRKHPLEWFKSKDGYAAQKQQGRVFECVQQPGEAMVVPLGWGHAALNIETSIGAAFEIQLEDPSRAAGRPGLSSEEWSGLNFYVLHYPT